VGYWLFKSEPEVYSIDDLERDGETFWEGVRNYEARNLLRDRIAVGDRVLFYHSQSERAVVGTAKVIGAASPDPDQFRPKSRTYDPKSSRDEPRWFGVTVGFGSRLRSPVTLTRIKGVKALKNMALINKPRLSVQPVTAGEWNTILKLADTGT
jgi:predicted RNA-binding protein with PUA-like domain